MDAYTECATAVEEVGCLELRDIITADPHPTLLLRPDVEPRDITVTEVGGPWIPPGMWHFHMVIWYDYSAGHGSTSERREDTVLVGDRGPRPWFTEPVYLPVFRFDSTGRTVRVLDLVIP